jgi:hypothetical protein
VRAEPTAASTEADSGQRDACVGAFEQSQILRKAGRLKSSLAHLTVCQESCPAEVKARCDEWAREVKAAMPTFRPRARDADAQPLAEVAVHLDGILVTRRLSGQRVEADPGAHRITFVARDGATREISLVLRERQKDVPVDVAFMHLRAPPSEDRTAVADKTPPTGAIVLAGVGAAALLAAGTLTVMGHLERAELEDCKDTGCDDDAVDSVATKWYAAGVCAGVGVLAISAAGVWWATSRGTSEQERSTSALSLRLDVSTGGAGFGIGGAF